MKQFLASFVCLLALAMSACGFSPMYGTSGTDPDAMNNVEIETIGGKYGQQLRNNLMDEMYRKSMPSHPQYALRVHNVSFNQNYLGLDKTTTAETRYQLTVSSNYSLIDLKTKQVVHENSVRSFVAYNALDSQFTTIVARTDAIDSGIEQISNRITQDLALYLGNPNKENIKPKPQKEVLPESERRVKVFN